MSDSTITSLSSSDDGTQSLVYYLHATTPLNEADVGEFPKEVNGQPAAYFWADAIRTGRYVHPSGSFELSVDGLRLDRWAENFRRMREAGIDVPVPVDHSTSARDNLGYVVDVKRDGDRLLLLHQLIGEEAIALAARNKVSLGIDPAFRDGRGVEFGDCIVHSSLTPVPVVPGQAGLVAMSRRSGAIEFHLAAEVARPGRKGAESFRRGVERLVKDGHVTPACRDRLVALFADERSLLLLSREDAGDVGEALLEALSHNRAVALGERTGLQSLSRVVPGDEAAVNSDLQTRMARMASGG